MAGKKIYHPSKGFEDALAAFADLYKKMGWNFSGVDGKALGTAAAAQRTERSKVDALEADYLGAHTAFAVAQESRYNMFKKALDAARAVSRDNKDVMAMIDKFKRMSAPHKAAPAPAPKT